MASARRGQLGAVVALLTLMATAAFAGPTAAERSPILGGLVAIRSPAADALAGKGRTRLVVRAPARAWRFRATLDGRDITGRFKRRGGLRVANRDPPDVGSSDRQGRRGGRLRYRWQ